MASDSAPDVTAEVGRVGIQDEYAKIIDLHKFYLEIGTKTAAGSFAIIGAVITFISQLDFPQSRIRFALAIPLLLSVGNALGFLAGIHFARDFKRQVDAAQRRLGASWRPHVELIVGMNVVIGVLFTVLAVGIAVLMIWPDRLPQLPTR